MPTIYNSTEGDRVRKQEKRESGRKASVEASASRAIQKKALQDFEDTGWKRMIIGEPSIHEIVIEEYEDEPIEEYKPIPNPIDNLQPQELIPKVEKVELELTEKVEDITSTMEQYALALETIPEEWINSYEDETAKKAIHKGRMTNGFKDFILANGYLK